MRTPRALGTLAITLSAALAAAAALTAPALLNLPEPTAAGAASPTHQDFVDLGHLPRQAAYVHGKLAHYAPGAAPATVDPKHVRDLYEMEYPVGWEEALAHPICSFCDHLGNGQDAYDFHDHVLSRLPGPNVENPQWNVVHVAPAYSDDPQTNDEVVDAYTAALPVTSAAEVRKLLRLRTADGAPVAEATDTGFVFSGPITRRPGD